MEENTVFTLPMLADYISIGLPTYQRNANLAYLRNLHRILKEKGIWASPLLGEIYEKRGEGFVLIARAEKSQ